MLIFFKIEVNIGMLEKIRVNVWPFELEAASVGAHSFVPALSPWLLPGRFLWDHCGWVWGAGADVGLKKTGQG